MRDTADAAPFRGPPADPAIAARLRAGLEPGEALALGPGGSWADLEREIIEDEGAILAALNAVVDRPQNRSGAAVAAAEALTAAVLTPEGGLEASDPRFHAWFADVLHGAGLRRLLGRAQIEGPTIGLLETVDGIVVSAWAGDAAASRKWPLAPALRARLDAAPGRLAVVVFAPSRSSVLTARAAVALDLSRVEARLAEALLFSPSLEIAAARIGVGRESARDALKRLMVKAGVHRSAELVTRLLDIMASPQPAAPLDEGVLAAVFALSPAEARVAARIATGATAREVGEALGLKAETVRGYAKAALAKSGVTRAKDLARLLVEARELSSLAAVDQPAFETAPAGRLRVAPSADGRRRVAFIDYGPSSAEAVFVFHGYVVGRTLPRAFVRRLQAAGLRPIVPQRPGYGLTDPADDYLTAAADDVELLVRRLKLRRPHVLARDGGAAVAVRLAERYPGLVDRFVLQNPQTPMAQMPGQGSLAAVFGRRVLGNPKLIGGFAELMRRHADAQTLERNLRRTCADVPADCAVLEDQAVVDAMVLDMQAMVARSAAGFVAQNALFAGGWEPPTGLTLGRWTIARSGGMTSEPESAWSRLPNLDHAVLEGAGYFSQYTHPAELTALLRA